MIEKTCPFCAVYCEHKLHRTDKIYYWYMCESCEAVWSVKKKHAGEDDPYQV